MNMFMQVDAGTWIDALVSIGWLAVLIAGLYKIAKWGRWID